jgi:hypothetical protein
MLPVVSDGRNVGSEQLGSTIAEQKLCGANLAASYKTKSRSVFAVFRLLLPEIWGVRGASADTDQRV